MVNKKILALAIIGLVIASAGLATAMFYYLQPLQVSIKDAPYDDLISINVEISAIQIHNVDEARWITLVECNCISNCTCDCSCNCSTSGEEEPICKYDLVAGTYDTIRIKFNHIRLQYNNGTLGDVEKFQNQNMVQNYWLEIHINFTYDGSGGKILFDITVDSNYEAVVTIVEATP
jgi:Domain of unknown function (DUF4382)